MGIGIGIVVGIIVLLILIVFGQYNTLVKLKMKVKQAKSGIDVYCQQRFDLIPNLIETVKGYMKHEKEVFDNITRLRTEYNNTKDIKVSQELNRQMNSLIAVAENYPDLKASEQFLNLQRKRRKKNLSQKTWKNGSSSSKKSMMRFPKQLRRKARGISLN